MTYCRECGESKSRFHYEKWSRVCKSCVQELKQAAAPCDANHRIHLNSFSCALESGAEIKFFNVPGNLTRREAAKLKRIITAYVEPDEGGAADAA